MIYKNILGVICFKAQGDNPLRFLNKVRDSKFISKDLYSINNEVFGKIYGVNYNKLTEIANENHMVLTTLKKQGIIFNFLPYKKRFGVAE